MRCVRQANTEAEGVVSRAILAQGIRLRRNVYIRHFRCRPDFVSVKHRLAVFIDGCFWHGCDLHGTTPKVNREWWLAKIAANRERDQNIVTRLRSAGWIAVRFWAHDSADSVANQISSILKSMHITGHGVNDGKANDVGLWRRDKGTHH
jgi:DNA mismatch endonuclease (patch repair protein)